MTAKTFTRAFDIGRQCDKGRRPNNEDKVLLVEEWRPADQSQRRALGRLYIVADGVGGNDDGEVASDRVVRQLMYHYYTSEHPAGISPPERLQRAIQATTREVFDESLRNNTNMRSTVVAALILDPAGSRAQRRLVVANVGDSPAILFRKGQPPRKLTQDHVKRDQSLSQAMGDEVVNVTIFNDQLQPDDVVVICSDGLSDGEKGPVGPREIEKIVRRLPAQAASDELVRLAKRLGSNDNISAIVIRNGERPPPVRAIMQSTLALLAVALLGVGIYGAGHIGGGEVELPGGGKISLPGGDNARGLILAPTSELLPTDMPPSATPVPPTAVPRPTRLPAKPTRSASGNGLSAQQSAAGTVTPILTSEPTPLTTTPEPPTATPEPPTATPEPPTATPEPTVPNLVGLSEEKARSILRARGIGGGPEHSCYDDRPDFADGQVVETIPPAGTPLREKLWVSIYVKDSGKCSAGRDDGGDNDK